MKTDPAQHDFSAQELAAFQDYFYLKTGIRLDGKRRTFTERRLSERLRQTEMRTFREYFALLRGQSTQTELQSLINEMTVNETYFFREDYQFECLTRNLLDEIASQKAPGEPIRIWSAPCSTGEEPYSLAIWILEHWPRADEFEIQIHASDVDTHALGRARKGIYDARALHRVPEHLLRKYFAQTKPEQWQIRAELRQSVDFSLVNVIEASQMDRMRHFDVIFCRNLLIYFDDASRKRAAESFYHALRPGGFICLGHSESMSRISPLFQPRKFPEALIHQKPLTGA